MKNQFIVTLLIVLMSGIMAMAQTKKPMTPAKKPSTTVKSSVPKTTTTKKTTTTTTTTTPVAPPPIVEQKKTTTTTITTETPTEKKTTTTPSTTTTTTTTQSSGPSKGKKTSEPRVKEPKPERVREPKPERAREPRPERVKTPRVASSGGEDGVKFGLRLEATQALTFESGGSYDISPGVNAGLFANIPFSEKVSIQPEVLYSMAVAKVDPAKITTNTILAPVTFNFNLGNGSTKFVISPGGYAQYLLSASSSTGGGVSVAADLTGVDKFGYGAVLGLGVKINGKFLIETRAFYDLKTKSNKDILATLGIGYMF